MFKFPSFCVPRKHSSITKLVQSKSWGTLEKLLTNPQRLQKMLDHSEQKDLQTILHQACCLYPPLDVIKLLDDAVPQSNKHHDEMGRHPIHVAALWGASPDVIEYLVDKEPAFASSLDKTGKTPLHCFCERYAENFPSWERTKLKDSMIKIIKMLSRAAPLSLIMEDFEELNAVEYAISSGMECKVLKTLQKECTNFWRKKHRSGARHEHIWDELRKDLESQKDISKRPLLPSNKEMVAQFTGDPPRENETSHQPHHRVGAVAA